MNLRKLLPRFNKRNHQPTQSPSPKIQPAKKILALPAATPQPQLPAPPANPVEMLDSIDKFFRRHLICDDYQYTLLTLWTLHTWCFRSFPTSAYLHVRSVASQSGKTLCLQLLAALCDSPVLATGAHWRSIKQNLLTSDRRVLPNKTPALSPPSTMLLDDCHLTLTSSERQRLLGMLNPGSRADCT